MENEELVIRIQAGENVSENMELLYSQIQGYIWSIAWRYRDTGEMEDLMQEGYLALYPAIENYDPAAGCKFLTYASRWIRQGMQRYLQNNGSCMRLPVQCLEQIWKMKRFQADFEKRHGREPSEVEIASFMWLPLEQVRALRKNACMASLRSLDAPVTGVDGTEDTTVGDLVAAEGSLEDCVVDQQDHEALRRILWSCVDGLPEIQASVIRNRYQKNLTLKECGAACGISIEATRQQHMKALRELRSYGNSELLRPFLPESDRIYCGALIGNGVEQFRRTWTSSTERMALDL